MTTSGTVGFARRTKAEANLAEQERLLAELTEQLAARETDLATSQAELGRFRIVYLQRFAPLYAELDRIELEIARLLAAADPSDPIAARRARRARRQAWQSEEAARAADASRGRDLDVGTDSGRPTDLDLRELYHQAAKALHPDLATTEDERARRTRLMAAVNDAYSRGDTDAIRAILDDEAVRPGAGASTGADIAERLARVKRMIARIHSRLAELEALQKALEADLLWLLYTECRKAWLAGADPLAGDEVKLRARIDAARDLLSKLQKEHA